VSVDDDVVGAIDGGLCVLLGATHSDTLESARAMATKVWHLRVFDDENGVMNRSLADTGSRSAALVVSQFTLYGDTSRGRRPSWIAAAPPDVAEPLVDEFVRALTALGAKVETGRFRAEMQVELVNAGPVTLMLEVS
jgi:D-tyrosyl-tRNA(Tyr) deacylase